MSKGLGSGLKEQLAVPPNRVRTKRLRLGVFLGFFLNFNSFPSPSLLIASRKLKDT